MRKYRPDPNSQFVARQTSCFSRVLKPVLEFQNNPRRMLEKTLTGRRQIGSPCVPIQQGHAHSGL